MVRFIPAISLARVKQNVVDLDFLLFPVVLPIRPCVSATNPYSTPKMAEQSSEQEHTLPPPADVHVDVAAVVEEEQARERKYWVVVCLQYSPGRPWG